MPRRLQSCRRAVYGISVDTIQRYSRCLAILQIYFLWYITHVPPRCQGAGGGRAFSFRGSKVKRAHVGQPLRYWALAAISVASITTVVEVPTSAQSPPSSSSNQSDPFSSQTIPNNNSSQSQMVITPNSRQSANQHSINEDDSRKVFTSGDTSYGPSANANPVQYMDTTDPISPWGRSLQFADGLRMGTFINTVKACVQAPYGSTEASMANQVLQERLPKTSTTEILSITDKLDPDDGLYYMLYSQLSKRGVDPISRLSTGRLMDLIEQNQTRESWHNKILREFYQRVPKLTDAEIALLLKMLPPLSQSRLPLMSELQTRGVRHQK